MKNIDPQIFFANKRVPSVYHQLLPDLPCFVLVQIGNLPTIFRILILMLLISIHPGALIAQRIYTNNWENLDGWIVEMTNPNSCNDRKAFEIVPTINVAGVADSLNANSSCIRMYLPQCQWIANSPHKRAEIRNSTTTWTTFHKERWYALSILVDENYPFSGNDIVFQFHDAPDSCDKWRNPPV